MYQIRRVQVKRVRHLTSPFFSDVFLYAIERGHTKKYPLFIDIDNILAQKFLADYIEKEMY